MRTLIQYVRIFPFIFALLFSCTHTSHLTKDSKSNPVSVPVDDTLQKLLKDIDLDKDKRITILDGEVLIATIETTEGEEIAIHGVYPLSVLLQELKLAQEKGQETLPINQDILFESPIDRTSRLIRKRFWDGLTRTIDEKGLIKIFVDPKMKTQVKTPTLYIPNSDKMAETYFNTVKNNLSNKIPGFNMKLTVLPRKITPKYVRGLDGEHGILTLALKGANNNLQGIPFVVPGGRFNEMYGWDSYFITLGLVADGRIDLARAMVDNFVYEITHYGKILNANRSYYLTRSQPPFTTSMILEVYHRLPYNRVNQEWFRTAMAAAMKEYHEVWMRAPRYHTQTGLSRYYGEGIGPCPEVEEGHYNEIVRVHAEKAGMAPQAYVDKLMKQLRENPKKSSIPKSLKEFFIHDRAIRESGHDTTYRFDNRTADFLTVDLNSLLFKSEMDFAISLEKRLLPSGKRFKTASYWKKRANKRIKAINKYLWDSKKKWFFDYDLKNKRRSNYESATTFYPLWAKLASLEQAEGLVEKALPALEAQCGIVSTSESSRGPISPERSLRQWDYPHGWAPHQIMIWQGLSSYGFRDHAKRLSYKWLRMIAQNARDYNGVVPEKYDVVKCTHQVFAEYGNVGTDFAYITKEGFGWMNTSIQLGIKLLKEGYLNQLREELENY